MAVWSEPQSHTDIWERYVDLRRQKASSLPLLPVAGVWGSKPLHAFHVIGRSENVSSLPVKINKEHK